MHERSAELDIPVFKHEFKGVSNPYAFLGRISWLREKNYDGIHCHLHQAAWEISRMRPFLSTKVLATVHGISTSLYYLAAHHLITVSDAVGQSLWPGLGKKSTLVYNGVETAPPGPQCDPGLSKSFIFATVHKNKGQSFVLDALKNENLKTRLTLVGEGSAEAEKELRLFHARLKNKDQINLVFQTGDLSSYWHQASFLVIPSYREALSYVALEALARAIPVLAAKTGGLKEVVTEGIDGLFFEPGNPESFREAYAKMESDYRKFARNLLAMPFLDRRPEFKLKTMLEETHKVYERIFASHNFSRRWFGFLTL